ncbi:MAG: DUF4097 domain-containing protein [Treponema sp.]|nr:DUF4097 domain-containing protein [Treponema sp.]
MKGNKIMGIIWLLIALLLCVILGIRLSKKESYSVLKITGKEIIGMANLYETKTFSPKEIKAFDIDILSESLYFEETNDKNISVEFYCTKETMPQVNVYQDCLKINGKVSKNLVSMVNRKIVVKLPKDYNANQIDISTASGSVHLNSLSTPKLDCSTSSGSIHLNNGTIDSADIKSNSGSIHLTDISAQTIDCNCTSGSIHLDGSFSKVEANAVSGSINLKLDKELSEKSSFRTTSGSIHLDIPENSNATFKYSVTSGSYNNKINGTKGKSGTDILGKGSEPISLHTTSGSITIQ